MTTRMRILRNGFMGRPTPARVIAFYCALPSRSAYSVSTHPCTAQLALGLYRRPNGERTSLPFDPAAARRNPGL